MVYVIDNALLAIMLYCLPVYNAISCAYHVHHRQNVAAATLDTHSVIQQKRAYHNANSQLSSSTPSLKLVNYVPVSAISAMVPDMINAYRVSTLCYLWALYVS